MEKFREVIKYVAIVAIAVVVYFRFVLPALAPTKKLAGNQATLAMCRWELTTWKAYEANSPVFDFKKLTDDQKRRVIMFGLNQDFSIRTYFAWDNASNRKSSSSARGSLTMCPRRRRGICFAGIRRTRWDIPTDRRG